MIGACDRAVLVAVGDFARLVTSVGRLSEDERLPALDRLVADVESLFDGRQSSHAVVARLAPMVGDGRLERCPFDDLIAAARIEPRATRYRTFGDLLDYLALSANPVGRLMLQAMALDTTDRRRLSDSVCSGLRLVSHIRRIGPDYAEGRVFVPLDDLARFDCSEADLGAEQASTLVRRVVALEVERARGLLAAGDELVARVPGRTRVALAGAVGRGRGTLAAVERARHDVLAGRARPRRSVVMASAAGALAAARRPVLPDGPVR